MWELFSTKLEEDFLSDVIAGDYNGKTLVAGRLAHHLSFRERDAHWQIWIAADEAEPVPLMLVGTDPYKQGWPQYHLFLYDWDFTNKAEPGRFFSFVPDDGLTQVEISRLRYAPDDEDSAGEPAVKSSN